MKENGVSGRGVLFSRGFAKGSGEFNERVGRFFYLGKTSNNESCVGLLEFFKKKQSTQKHKSMK